MTRDELEIVLDNHALWLTTKDTDNVLGERADLSGADLRRADLNDAILE